MENLNELQQRQLDAIQETANKTMVKMVDSIVAMNKRFQKVLIVAIICFSVVLTSFFGSIIYFLNNFEVEATTEETFHYIEGNGTINSIGGDGNINTIHAGETLEMEGVEND